MVGNLFHLNVSAHSRSQGHSAAAKVAYIGGLRLADPWTERVHNYRRKEGVLKSGCINYDGTLPQLARLRTAKKGQADLIEVRLPVPSVTSIRSA